MEVELPVGDGDAELESPDGIKKFPNPSYNGEKRVAKLLTGQVHGVITTR